MRRMNGEAMEKHGTRTERHGIHRRGRRHGGRRLLTMVLCLCMVGADTLPTAAADMGKSESGAVVTETAGALLGEAWNGTIATEFAGGRGTQESPYEISTGAQLAYLAQQVNDGTGADAYYKLTADIDLGSNEWIPIGNSVAHMFKGHFDGNGKTVTFNGTIKDQVYDSEPTESSPTYRSIAGLFGLCQKAEISNLTLAGTFRIEQNDSDKKGADIWSLYAGGICGYADGCTFTSCSNAASITVSSVVNPLLGGICGEIADTTGTTKISGCTNGGALAITAGRGTLGGIFARGTSGATVSGCTNSGNLAINGTSSASDYNTFAGGIGGEVKGTVSGCSNTGAVSISVSASGCGAEAGGICGFVVGTVSACSNTGAVSAGAADDSRVTARVGGISGCVDYSGSLTGCLSSGNVTAVSSTDTGYAGGVSAAVWGEATVTGCYYSDTCSITGESSSSVLDGKAGISATEDEIKNGTVAYYMNQALDDSAAYRWGQDLTAKTDPSLTMSSTAGGITGAPTVYPSAPCPLDFSNTDANTELKHGMKGFYYEKDGDILWMCCACGAKYEQISLLSTNVVYNGKDQAVTMYRSRTGSGFDEYKVREDYKKTEVKYYKLDDAGAVVGDALNGAPKAAGYYRAELTLQDKKGADVTISRDYRIEPKELTVKSATATERAYNGSAVVDITEVALSGAAAGDAVSVDTNGLTGTLTGADAGTYTTVTLSTEKALTLLGDADVLANYSFTQPTTAVTTNVNIKKLTGITREIALVYGLNSQNVALDLKQYLPEDCGAVASVTVSDESGFLAGGKVTVDSENSSQIKFVPLSGDDTMTGSFTATVETTNYESSVLKFTVKLVNGSLLDGAIRAATPADTTADVTVSAGDGATKFYLYYTTERLSTVNNEIVTATGAGHMSSTTGVFSLSGLKPETTYYLYAAVENATGVGNVAFGTLTTKESSGGGNSSAGGSSSSGGSSSTGGNSSGGSGSAGGSTGGGSSSAGGQTTPDTSEKEPQIAGENGAVGWDAIRKVFADAKDGDTVTIRMNGDTQITGKVLKSLAGKDVTVTLELGGHLRLTINGRDLNGIRFKNKTEYHVLYLWVVASLRTIGR